VAYSVSTDLVKLEVLARGPVLAVLPITNDVLEHVGACLAGKPVHPLNPIDTTDHGNLGVAILGWDADAWIIALPWGRFPMWDGTIHVSQNACVNVCALSRQEDVSVDANSGARVTVFPPLWEPLTTKPLPEIASASNVSGKYKNLKKKNTPKPVSTVIHQWRPRLTEEHLSLTVQCAVTMVIIVVGVILLIMLRRKC
jgi:hypothetical protein